MKMNKTIILRYSLIILGAVIFIYYIWIRFIRERTTKFLPFNLSFLYMLTLIWICCIFAFIVYSLIRRKGSVNPTLEIITDWIYTPISELEIFLRNLSFIKPYYYNFMQKNLSSLEYLIVDTNYFFIIFWLIPRTILLSALFIDVFIFHQFHYRYMFVYFGILLLFNRIFKYSLKNFIKKQIEELKFALWSIQTPYYPRVHPSELEPDYNPDDDDIPDMYIPPDIYIKHYVNRTVYYNEVITYKFYIPTRAWKEHMWKEHTGEDYIRYISKEQAKIPKHLRDQNLIALFKKRDERFEYEDKCRREILEPKIELTCKLSAFLEEYSYTSNTDDKFTKIKIVIYSLYLFCWSYVLIISMLATNFATMDISLLLAATDSIDPFSGHILDFIYEKHENEQNHFA